MLASGGYDGCVRVWDARHARLCANLQAHRAPVRSLLVEGRSVWSGSTDGTVRCWDLQQLTLPPAHSPGAAQEQALHDYIAAGVRPRPYL